MNRKFVETEVFQEDLIDNGITIEQIRTLQRELLDNPEKGSLIAGTGGSRKVRLGKSGSGKSGGFRIMYTDFKDSEIIYFWMVFGKGEQDNLTSEQKKWIKAMNSTISQQLKKGV